MFKNCFSVFTQLIFSDINICLIIWNIKLWGENLLIANMLHKIVSKDHIL